MSQSNFEGMFGLEETTFIEEEVLAEVGPSHSVSQEIAELRKELERRERDLAKAVARVARLERTIEIAKVGGWELDLRDHTRTWSIETCRILEIDPPITPSLDEASTGSFYSPDSKATIESAVKSAIENGTGFDIEVQMITAKGRTIWVRDEGSAVIENGKVIKLQGALKDITARKTAELALLESQSRTRLLVKAAKVGLWDWNLVTNEVYFSPEWKGQLGYAEHELSNGFVEWESRLHPDDRDRTMQAVRDFQQHTTNVYEIEFRLRHRDGGWRWILARADLERDENGNPLRMMGCHVDITDRKRTEEALRESEQRINYALDATRDGLWDWNIETGEVHFSPQWARLLGYTPEQVPPRVEFFFEILHPEDVPRVQQILQMHLDGFTAVKQDEVRLRMRTGEFRWFYDRGKVVVRDDSGKPLRMVGTITDITDRKQAEERLKQSQKLESMGRLAGGVAHDFNNMLGVILGHADFAMRKVDAADSLYPNIIEIRRAAQRSADLTRQLLAFASRQIVAPKLLNVNDNVKDLLELLSRLLGENVKIDWRPGCDLWSVQIDPSQFDQILTNLCVNARDAIPDLGCITIETAHRVVDQEYCNGNLDAKPGEYVWISVRDNGVGMSKQTLAKIFEPFFTTKPIGKGTGLGLATVYGAVRQNDGFVEVNSELGKGTSIEIFLPRAQGKEEIVARPESLPSSSPGQETILLVEDEPALLMITQSLLEALGYRVLAASSPREAIEIAKQSSCTIDLLLTDVVMPEMNGRDLANQLVGEFPHLRRLYMSGYTAEVIENRGILNDGTDFIQKPYTTETLSAKLRSVLDA